MLKANLHFHSADDPRHSRSIGYSTKDGIDHAAQIGMHALALTYHHFFAWTPEFHKYAAERGVLLIPGVELYVRERRGKGLRRHVIVLNCTKEIESVRTFRDLEQYRKKHPQIFIVAPHPYFYGHFSLKGFLEKYIHLFDAIEHSWFYSFLFNRNHKGERVAKKYNLPFIATSDTHNLKYLGVDYAEIDAAEKTIEALLDAVRQKTFTNVTAPKSFLKDMLWTQGLFFIQDYFRNNFLRKDYYPKKADT